MKTRMQKVKMQAVAVASLGFVCLLIGGCSGGSQGADVSSLSREEQSKLFQNNKVTPKMAEMSRKYGGQGAPAQPGQTGAPPAQAPGGAAPAGGAPATR